MTAFLIAQSEADPTAGFLIIALCIGACIWINLDKQPKDKLTTEIRHKLERNIKR